MNSKNISAWFFESGVVGVPKNLLALMEPLGLQFEDLGHILYILYCGPGEISSEDKYALGAVKSLAAKGLIMWHPEEKSVDFSPMFDRIDASLGESTVRVAVSNPEHGLDHSGMVKQLEKEQGRFLTVKEKQDLEKAALQYRWSYELLVEIYGFYTKNYRRHSYDFTFFAQMAYGAKVTDLASFRRFIANIETGNTKVQEILRRLGKYNNASMAQREMYLKWANEWKFTHELILRAADETINADNPSMGYMDSILTDWQELGIATIEAVEARKEEWLAHKKQQRAGGKTQRRKNPAPGKSFPNENRDFSIFVE